MKPSDHEGSELNAVEEAALNEYLRRDSAVSQRYRELGSAEVPAALDRAVLAQANAAVAGKKTSRWRGVTRWSAPLALAASVVVVVSIFRQPAMQNELARPAAPTTERLPIPYPAQELNKAAAPAQENDTAANRAAADEDLRKEPLPAVVVPMEDRSIEAPLYVPTPEILEKKLVGQTRETTTSAIRQLAAQAPSLPASAAPAVDAAPTTAIRSMTSQPATLGMRENQAPAAKEEVAVTAQRRDHASDTDLSEIIVTALPRQGAATNGAGPRGTVLPSSAADASAKAYRENDPQEWLVHIRQLREDGETNRANREWRRFRKQYPDVAVDEKDAARPPP